MTTRTSGGARPFRPATGLTGEGYVKLSPIMSSTHLQPVQPVRPVAAYLGGKRNLAKRICAIIEATPHTAYCEPFVGMGGIFLRRRQRPKCEVINDLSGDVFNFFRIAREHPAYLNQELALRFTCRAEFDRLRSIDPATLTDLQRAIRFLYLQRVAFGGKVTGRAFGVDVGVRAAFDVRQVRELLDALGDRLDGVTIENLTWSAFIDRYDRPGTLFYLDPPYWGCERDYGPDMFTREDFAVMADQLARIRGRFLLSINDRPEVREIFAAFEIAEVQTTYGIMKDGQRPAAELIITGGR